MPVLLLLSCFSCQKVIHVNVQTSASQYIITGNVTNQTGPYVVNITQSISYDQDNNFPAVSGALVVIQDKDAGISDTLKELTPGNYNTSLIIGQPGHTYQLYVNINNQVFTASSQMPQPVYMDSLYQQTPQFGKGFSIVPVYTDPANVKNYYHFAEFVNNVQSKDIYIRNDNLTDGETLSVPLSMRDDTAMHIGDNIMVQLQTVDSAVFQYYQTLQQTIRQNSATPANPVTNIVGGKLGYFSAHALTAKTIQLH